MGNFVDEAGDRRGFLLSQGEFTTLDVPGVALTVAQGINNAGMIAGLYQGADGTSHGFVLSNGVYTTVDVPGASWTEIYSINAWGQVVGAYGDEDDVTHGFIGTPAH